MTEILPAKPHLIVFDYPVLNAIGFPLEWVTRRVEVHSREFFFDSPLPLDAFRRCPMLRRGGRLVTGRDIDLNAMRNYYLDAAYGERLPDYRLAAYDPTSPADSAEWLSRPFAPTRYDRQIMLATFERLDEKDFGRLLVGAFPVRP